MQCSNYDAVECEEDMSFHRKRKTAHVSRRSRIHFRLRCYREQPDETSIWMIVEIIAQIVEGRGQRGGKLGFWTSIALILSESSARECGASTFAYARAGRPVLLLHSCAVTE
jgi:hypothetical protein